MKKIDPDKVGVILATDCGSTTTKAILIQKVGGEYRQTHRGEAPSTVEEPFADVTIGVVNAVTEVAELADRRLVDDNGRIIKPARCGPEGRQDQAGTDARVSSAHACRAGRHAAR